MRTIGSVLALLTLAACGADGEPQPPQIGGTVTVSTSGVSAGANVTVARGPFLLGLGIGL